MISAFSANSAIVCLPVRCPISLIERTISRSIGSCRISLHEAAVDLQEVDREVLEIAERRQAGAEVIERELAAELLQRLDEAVRLREARDRRGLRDLEADLRGIEAAAAGTAR